MTSLETKPSRLEEEKRQEYAGPRGPEAEREIRRSAEVVTGGATGQTIGGAAAAVLSIIALGGVLTTFLGPIATIAIGAALLFEGGAITARFSRLISELGAGRLTEAELGGGMSAQFIGGAAGVVLGILSLVGIEPATLMAVAIIIFGGVLMLGSSATSRLSHLAISMSGAHETAMAVAREAVLAGAGAQALVGAGAVVLGILSLIGMVPMTLSLVALLSIGSAMLLSGAALGGRMMSAFRYH